MPNFETILAATYRRRSDMIVACALETCELLLRARRGELLDFARAVEVGAGSFSLATNVTVAPYDTILAGLDIGDEDRQAVRFALDGTGKCLVVTGTDLSRRVFAQNLRGISETRVGEHSHIEYFPGHDYLDVGSLALVVELSE